MKSVQIQDVSHEGHKTEEECNSSYHDLTKDLSSERRSALQGQDKEIPAQFRWRKTHDRDRHPTPELRETEPPPTKEETQHILALSRAGLEIRLIMKLMGHSYDTIQRLILCSERISREERDRAEQSQMQQEFGQMLLGSDPYGR